MSYIPGTSNISNINNYVGINTLLPQTTLDVNGTTSSINLLSQIISPLFLSSF